MASIETLRESLELFDDRAIRAYIHCASKWRDQLLTDRAAAEAELWNSFISWHS